MVWPWKGVIFFTPKKNWTSQFWKNSFNALAEGETIDFFSTHETRSMHFVSMIPFPSELFRGSSLGVALVSVAENGSTLQGKGRGTVPHAQGSERFRHSRGTSFEESVLCFWEADVQVASGRFGAGERFFALIAIDSDYVQIKHQECNILQDPRYKHNIYIYIL